jgi:hypothetical protein
MHPLVLREDSLLILGNEAFIRREDPSSLAVPQGRETLYVVGAGRQEGVVGDQAAPCDAQAEFEAIVMPLFRGTGAIIGLSRKTVVPPPTPCVGTDRERQRVNHLDWIGGMPAPLDQAPRDRGLELPEVRSLPYKKRAIRKGGEERAIMRPEIGEEIRSAGQLEKFTANDHGQDLNSAQLGHETAVP